MAEIRIPAAGDPFTSKPITPERDIDHPSGPHGCIDGLVYIGHLIRDEDDEEVEVIEALPCRRCMINEHHERF